MIEPMDHEEAMRKLADLLGRMRERGDAVAFGLVVAFADGSIGTGWESSSHSQLLGGISVLERRVLDAYERDS